MADGTLSDNAYRNHRDEALRETSCADYNRIRHSEMKIPPVLPIDPVSLVRLTAEEDSEINRRTGHVPWNPMK